MTPSYFSGGRKASHPMPNSFLNRFKFLGILFAFFCITTSTQAQVATSAKYRVTFDAVWSATTHPTDFPSNPHFSGLIGLTHTANVALFELGGMASQGIVNMAETGSKSPLTSEIQSVIDGGQGQTLISGGGISNSPGMVSVEFDMNNSHPLVSITTMIAPSPDWFVGVRDLNLFENGDWVNSKSVQVSVYDAGSDSGVSFTSPNQPTSPRAAISMITDGPLAENGVVASMGTMTFTRIDTATCEAAGGTIAGGPFSFCVGDGEADNIPAGSITLSGNSGSNSQWVVTDEQGEILGLPPMPSAVDFDGAGDGVCLIWHLSFEDGLEGAVVGQNASDLKGCFSLSNSIRVERDTSGEACAATCEAAGGTIAGGPFSFCVGDGESDNIPAGSITLSGNSGSNSQWVVTDEQGEILGLPPMPSAVDFDGAGDGVCLIWHLSFEDGLEGAVVGQNASDLKGCFSLSNSIRVERNTSGEACAATCEADGGTIVGGPFTFCVDGQADNIPAGAIGLSGASGPNSQWVVTDPNGKILGLPSMPSIVDFDGAGVGVCLIWHLSFEDGLEGLEADKNVSDLKGCFAFSNSISVTRTDECDTGNSCTAPMDVQVDVLSSRRVRVDWENVPDARRYLIEIRFAGKTRIVGRGLVKRSRVHIYAPAGRDYEFRIKTICNDGGESEYTDWISFGTPNNLAETESFAKSRNSDEFSADITIGEIIEKSLVVYPNPAIDWLTIDYSLSTESAQLRVFHVSGQQVLETRLRQGDSHPLNISGLTNGLYYLTIEENGQTTVSKRIVKHGNY